MLRLFVTLNNCLDVVHVRILEKKYRLCTLNETFDTVLRCLDDLTIHVQAGCTPFCLKPPLALELQ